MLNMSNRHTDTDHQDLEPASNMFPKFDNENEIRSSSQKSKIKNRNRRRSFYGNNNLYER
jgi:hypothetical protein